MRVLRPEMAAWLLAIPLAALCWFLHYRYKWRHRSETLAFGAPALSRRTRFSRDLAVLVLSVVTLGLIAGAMMRPQLQMERRTPTFEPRDLVLMLDRSISMRARDVEPSRFLRAIEEIRTFLRRKPATIDRVALIGFAATPVVLSYPTTDVDSLSFYLDFASDDSTLFFGTDIGAALSTALGVIRLDRPQVPPVFVVISDGEDQGEQLAEATAAVARERIRVHSIGIGSDAGVPIPLPFGEGEELLRNELDQPVITRFDGTTLQRLATATGGQYFRSVSGGELLAALDRIVVGERRQVGWKVALEYRDLYLLLLAAAGITSFGLVRLL